MPRFHCGWSRGSVQRDQTEGLYDRRKREANKDKRASTVGRKGRQTDLWIDDKFVAISVQTIRAVVSCTAKV